MKLTPVLKEQICSYVRAGAFPQKAAEACGVSAAQLALWLKRKGFKKALQQAVAQARVAAELRVFQEDAKTCLGSGPGKDTPSEPGWTAVVKPRITELNQQINALLHPQLQDLFATLLQLLAPFPEARVAVAQALAADKLFLE